MDYLFLCSNIQDTKSLETNEWKAKSQAYSLHILMWNRNNQQIIFIKDISFGRKNKLESGRMSEI